MNGILEDIGAELGYTATAALVAWFGGSSIYVPAKVSEVHPICRAIGLPAYRRLCAAFGSETINLPDGKKDADDRRDRQIAGYLAQGIAPGNIGALLGLSERRVAQIRTRLLADGFLPLEITPGKTPQEKAP